MGHYCPARVRRRAAISGQAKLDDGHCGGVGRNQHGPTQKARQVDAQPLCRGSQATRQKN